MKAGEEGGNKGGSGSATKIRKLPRLDVFPTTKRFYQKLKLLQKKNTKIGIQYAPLLDTDRTTWRGTAEPSSQCSSKCHQLPPPSGSSLGHVRDWVPADKGNTCAVTCSRRKLKCSGGRSVKGTKPKFATNRREVSRNCNDRRWSSCLCYNDTPLFKEYPVRSWCFVGKMKAAWGECGGCPPRWFSWLTGSPSNCRGRCDWQSAKTCDEPVLPKNMPLLAGPYEWKTGAVQSEDACHWYGPGGNKGYSCSDVPGGIPEVDCYNQKTLSCPPGAYRRRGGSAWRLSGGSGRRRFRQLTVNMVKEKPNWDKDKWVSVVPPNAWEWRQGWWPGSNGRSVTACKQLDARYPALRMKLYSPLTLQGACDHRGTKHSAVPELNLSCPLPHTHSLSTDFSNGISRCM